MTFWEDHDELSDKEKIGALRSWIKTLEQLVTWQPIATAPKDGTSILVYPPTWPSKKASIASYDRDSVAKNPKPFWKRDDDLGQVTRSRACPPTHWMFLPEPPEGE